MEGEKREAVQVIEHHGQPVAVEAAHHNERRLRVRRLYHDHVTALRTKLGDRIGHLVDRLH